MQKMATEILTTISPYTNQPILTRHGISPAEIQRLPQAATDAFCSFRTSSLAERQTIITKALRLLEQKREILAQELTAQMGRPIAYTAKEITTAVKRGEYLVKISQEVLADTPGETETGYSRYIRKLPIGPVLVVFAWNYPYLILVNSLIPALLAGNTVILKPSPQAPTIVEHIATTFRDAGLPPNVIQYFHSATPSLIESLIQAPQIAHVCFTGSAAGGLAIQQAAASRIVSVGLELGGKDPAYVRADVDLSWVAAEIVDGALFNSGQSCCSIERVYVHATIHDDFIAAVQRVLIGYRLGDPADPQTQIGPVVSQRARDTIQAHIQDALKRGAIDATPPNQSFTSPPATGNFVRPTLLTHVTHDMTIMTQETFGPVIPVMKVSDDAEAIRLMNASEFGLTASIWTKDTARGTEIADEIEAGTVFINRCDFPSPDLAWTGWKNSGKGVTLSRFGFDQFIKLKSFHIKDYPQ